jgi:pimeloyl-ACP methyl ester carboxylesterase
LLGARYADAHPGRVRTMVLDGAVDPALDATEAVRAQAIGFERALQRFLDDCARDDGCAFHSGGDPATAFDRLIDAIDAETLYAVGADGVERGLGPGEADLGVAQALYAGREGWPLLASALVEAARGDGSSLLRLADQYSGRGEDGRYTDDLEASYAIGCLDGEAPSDIAAVERLATEVAAVAPRLGEATVWYGLPCSVWPAPPDPLVGETRAAGAAPILVVATEHDPATPSFQAESLARQLDDAVLVTLDDDGHTAYLRGNACIDDIVHRYLVDLAVPRGGSRC